MEEARGVQNKSEEIRLPRERAAPGQKEERGGEQGKSLLGSGRVVASHGDVPGVRVIFI